MKKIIYLVLDGMGDRPCRELGGKTPLEAASTFNLDALAKRGQTGRVTTVGEGIAPESDVAVISILGYDAHKYYTGRGPLESHAEGLEVLEGDLAFRVNFATCGADGKIVDRRVGRNLSSEEAAALAEEVNRNLKLESRKARFWLKSTIGHRGVLVIRSLNGKLSGHITNTDPAYDREGLISVAKDTFENQILPAKPLPGHESSKPAQDACALTNEFIQKSAKILSASSVNEKRVRAGKAPGNAILLRDAGDRLPQFPSFFSLFHLRFGCFVEMPVERGIALLTGMDVVEVPVARGAEEKNYPIWAEQAIVSLRSYDGLYIHIKGPDEPAHDGRALDKQRAIEQIDRFFLDPLLKELDLSQAIIAVTADHATPCPLKAHSDDPVPFLVSGGNIRPDGSPVFSEPACSRGSLGLLHGNQVMPLLSKLAAL